MASLFTPGSLAVHVGSSSSAVAAQVGDFCARLASEAVARHGKFSVALSGGSLPAVLAKDLKKLAANSNVDLQLEKWDIWYADEWV